MPDKSLETLAREWLDTKSFMASTWAPKWRDDLVGSLVALVHSRDERAVQIVEVVSSGDAATAEEACGDIKRRLEAPDGE